MKYDVPSNPQIFGQLLHEAGVEGVLYPSKMTGKDCVAIFTRNFEKGNSWVSLDEAPLALGVPSKIASSNFPFAEMTAKELGANEVRH